MNKNNYKQNVKNMSKTLDIFFIYDIIFNQEKEVMYLYLISYK